MHPAGSVHVYPNLLWPPNKKNVRVNFEGYVIDEMSMVRDGIGVSQAYLLVNGKKISSGRSPATLLNTICAGFTDRPEECDTKLSSANPSAGFGFGGSGTGSAGGCAE